MALVPNLKEFREYYDKRLGTDKPFDVPYIIEGEIYDSYMVWLSIQSPNDKDYVKRILEDFNIPIVEKEV